MIFQHFRYATQSNAAPRFSVMCFFPYPAPKPRKSTRAKKSSKKATSSEDIQDITRKVIEDAMSPPYGSPYGYYPQRLEEEEPAYITRGQWATHSQTAQGALSTTRENGKKLDDLNAYVSGGITEAGA